MLVQVVELFRDGLKRPMEEIRAAEPMVGYLVSVPEQYHNGRREMTLCGDLPGSYSSMQLNLVPPLFAPHSIVIGDDAMTIKGQQYAIGLDGQVRLYAQAWLVKMAPPGTRVSDPHAHPEGSHVRSRS